MGKRKEKTIFPSAKSGKRMSEIVKENAGAWVGGNESKQFSYFS